MSLDDKLTEEEKRFVDEKFSEFVEKGDYTGALRFFRNLNGKAQEYIKKHDEHGWGLTIAKGYDKL